MKKSLSFFIPFLLAGIPLFAQFNTINTGTNSNLNRISILNNNIVINGTTNYLVKLYYDNSSLIPLTVPGPLDYFNDYLNRIDTNNFFILSYNTDLYNFLIFKSGDGGYNWEPIFDSTGLFLNTLVFFDTLEGIATGTFYKLIRTKDGGKTWLLENSPLTIASAVKKFGDNTICIGMNERFCISDDRGITWSCALFEQADPRDFFFLNRDTLFATSYSSTGTFFSSSFDGGITWQHFPFENGIEPYGIYFKSSYEGYVVGRDQLNNNYGVILKTTDIGQNWTLFNTNITTLLTDIKFLNDTIAFIAGTNGVLLKLNTNELSTDISNIINPDFNISINGNLFKNSIIFSFNSNQNSTLQIFVYDYIGKKYLQLPKKQIPQGKYEEHINLEKFDNGIYFLITDINGQLYRFKIIKI